MPTPQASALLQSLYERHESALGSDGPSYMGHVWRVLAVYEKLTGKPADELDAVAAFFHDVGIWTHHTNDYLPPSVSGAREYLKESGHGDWADAVSAMIDNHHKITAYKGPHAERVEPFRKADLVDFSFGTYKAGLPPAELGEIFRQHPPADFRRFLLRVAVKWTFQHPTRPFPIFRL